MIKEDQECPDAEKPLRSSLEKILALFNPVLHSPHFQNNWDLVIKVCEMLLEVQGASTGAPSPPHLCPGVGPLTPPTPPAALWGSR